MELSMEFKGSARRRITTFIDSCCFVFTRSFIWFFNLISILLFRCRKETNNLKHHLNPCDDEVNDDESGSPRLTFKFQHQFPHHHRETRKSSFLQKNCSCEFMQETESKTWRNSETSITESLRLRDSCCTEEIHQNSCLSLKKRKDSQRPISNASRRIDDDKHEFSGFNSAGDSCSVKENEQNTSFSLHKESQQPSFNGSRMIQDERLMEFSGFSSARDFFCSVEEIERNKFLNMEHMEQEKSKFLSDEFSILDSDGYSVKELAADSDSSGFFSEGDSPSFAQTELIFKIQEAAEPDEMQMELTDSSEEKSMSNTISFFSSPEVDALLGEEMDELEREVHCSGDEGDDEDNDDELEALLEELNLIKALRIETRRRRTVNLPTIREESEAPKVPQYLRPWKIEEENGDAMDEVHKFYRIYRERIKKLDTLNYQKMNSVGLKHCLQSMREQKSSLIPAIKSLLPHGLWGCSLRTGVDDQHEKWMKEVQSDLETVYVGQTCLSWEWLRWQYEKLLEFDEEDEEYGGECTGQSRYNEVAEEFQQFQAILQRFMENEATRGPRLSHYVENRFLLENHLQVPILREDSRKEVEDESKGKHIITSDILRDIMEESIGLFWEFVRADKDETPGILKAFRGTHVQPEDSGDYKLMAEIKCSLYKKEKKLRDIVRTGNCLAKKLKRHKQVRLDGNALFSQVDLKLVSRVLRMSRITTQQLIWCHSKLSTIWFVDAKVYREPSFLLFPC